MIRRLFTHTERTIHQDSKTLHAATALKTSVLESPKCPDHDSSTSPITITGTAAKVGFHY